MKNIKFLFLLMVLFISTQLSFAQATDENGRPEGTMPGPVVETVDATANNASTETTTGDYVDLDEPREGPENNTDNFYPADLDFISDEIMASMSPVEMAEKLNELNTMLNDLRRVSEELRLENQIIRESLTNCCSASALGLSASDAYLIQNAPNPFNERTEIRYFVPAGLEDVELKICNIKGEVMDAIKIVEAGYGKVELRANTYNNGSFVYTLSVKGEVIDSKVMIITE